MILTMQSDQIMFIVLKELVNEYPIASYHPIGINGRSNRFFGCKNVRTPSSCHCQDWRRSIQMLPTSENQYCRLRTQWG